MCSWYRHGANRDDDGSPRSPVDLPETREEALYCNQASVAVVIELILFSLDIRNI